MSLSDKLWTWVDRGLRRARTDRVRGRRSYEAAQTTRYTNDWSTSSPSINFDIRRDLSPLRARARNLHQNDDYAKRFLQLVKMNVAGPKGFTFQSFVKNEGGKPDRPANMRIEEAFADWSKREHCTVTGLLSFRQVQHLLTVSVARDGEALVRMVYDKTAKYGFRLQILEPDLLDENKNGREANGNYVLAGVEIDSWRRPVAYHLKRFDPSLEMYSWNPRSEATERVSAKDMFHLFDIERAFQVRGVSSMAASMLRLKMLGGYEHAALVAARIGAANMGFYSPSPDNPQEFEGTDKDASGNVIQDVEPGQISALPPGSVFSQFDAKFPSDAHEPFTKGALRGISAGLGVAYSSLTGDLRDVNYSSIRAGLIDEREAWRTVQMWFTEAFLEPVFSEWLRTAMSKGAVNLPMSKFDKFNKPVFIGRRWAWVDPEKDIRAALLEISAGLSTSTQYLAEKGENIEDVYQELADEQALADEYGVRITMDGKTTTAPVPATEDSDQVKAARLLVESALEGRSNGNGQH